LDRSVEANAKGKCDELCFQGAADLQFKNRSSDWIENDSIISNGSGYADIDNDGVDVITNNTTTASIYIIKRIPNQTI
jgi:hypothetical protein